MYLHGTDTLKADNFALVKVISKQVYACKNGKSTPAHVFLGSYPGFTCKFARLINPKQIYRAFLVPVSFADLLLKSMVNVGFMIVYMYNDL